MRTFSINVRRWRTLLNLQTMIIFQFRYKSILQRYNASFCICFTRSMTFFEGFTCAAYMNSNQLHILPLKAFNGGKAFSERSETVHKEIFRATNFYANRRLIIIQHDNILIACKQLINVGENGNVINSFSLVSLVKNTFHLYGY
jgi:hypothetical protein